MSEEWRAQARCIEAPKELFFPVGKNGRYDELTVARARSYCDVCPVSDECYTFARLDKERSGIWGGVVLETSSKQNRRVAQARKAAEKV